MLKKKVITLSEPILGEEEKRAICGVIDSGWLTMGERVADFEKAFSQLHGVEDAVAVNSCTAALHLSLKALNIGPGDEVLVPSLTFVATANAVLYVGATPIFVDITELDIPHLSIDDAQTKCTSKTKAVIVMHYGGYPVDVTAWRSLCDENGFLMIEDAAHAPGVRTVGQMGDAAAFSFFSNKNMATAEGGMIFASKHSVLQNLRHLRAHGMSSDTLTRHRGHAYRYDVSMLGYNYRMDELRAAIGLVQLKNLLAWNEKRSKLCSLYRKFLAEYIPEVLVPFENRYETAAHLMPVLLPAKLSRQKVMKQLRDDGIQTSVHYPPVHKFTYYRERYPFVHLPKTEKFCDRELSLPLHPSLTQNEIIRVVESIKKTI